MTQLELPHQHSSPFMVDYLLEKENMKRYFDYTNHNSSTIKNRYNELLNREFPREALSSYLESFHDNLPTSDKVWKNIELVKDAKTVFVVGGQQAGLLGGPLFTIYKCMTIIKYAEECQKTIGAPVIPIFWIAGEDHDYDEINHIYIPHERTLRKVKFGKSLNKQSLTEMDFPKEEIKVWAKELIKSLGETKHTKEIHSLIETALEETNTFTQFFAYLLSTFFNKYGLLYLDSGDHRLREIEAPFFKEMITNNEIIDSLFVEQTSMLKRDGYQEPIEVQNNNAQLFLNNRNNRVLLYRDNEGNFVGKNNECKYTKSQLLELSDEKPYLLSNNVVTRPLMQEFLLPTLTFVGGPGEIAYWSTLKKIFNFFDCKMPPLLPRLSLTVIEPKIDKILKERELQIEETIQQGAKGSKEEWLASQVDIPLQDVLQNVKKEIAYTHQSLSEIAIQTSKGLEPLAAKNLAIIESQIDFLGKHIDKTINEKYEHELGQYDLLDLSIKPFGIPQERIWNVFYFLNHYGLEFIDHLFSETYQFNNQHKIIFL